MVASGDLRKFFKELSLYKVAFFKMTNSLVDVMASIKQHCNYNATLVVLYLVSLDLFGKRYMFPKPSLSGEQPYPSDNQVRTIHFNAITNVKWPHNRN
eukprot:5753995-Amphidinium_carterae.1